jgi:hypothetical protein
MSMGKDSGNKWSWNGSTFNIHAQFVAKFASFESEYDNGDSGTSKIIDWNNGNFQKVTMDDSCTFTFVNPSNFTPSRVQLKIIQDGSGSHTVTLPAYMAPGGTAYTATATAGAVDIVTFYFDGSAYYLVASQDFQTP